MKRKVVVTWSLRKRLLGAFLLVILTSIGLVILIVSQYAPIILDEIGLLVSQRRAARLVPFFVDYYREAGSWEGVTRLIKPFNSPLPPIVIADSLATYPNRAKFIEALNKERLILLDREGHVIADSAELLLAGQPLPSELEIYTIPINNSADTMGYLLVTGELEQTISSFVMIAVRRTFLVSALLTAGLAFLVSLILAQRLANPIQNLNEATKHLASGTTTGILPVQSTDEIGQLTQSFNDMILALQHQKQLRRHMMADIVHELQTPLTILQLNIEALKDDLQSPVETAAALSEEVDTLRQLTQDLRLLSLAEAGSLRLNLELLDTSSFLNRVIDSWRAQARHQQVELKRIVPMDLPRIYGDEKRLAQVLNNLLSNAFRYTAGGKMIEVGAQSGNGEILMWVTDNGPGIPEDHLPHVFERFYRADPTDSQETGRSGLGLAIAKQLVARHGGYIWVESGIGRGTTFFLKLPPRQNDI